MRAEGTDMAIECHKLPESACPCCDSPAATVTVRIGDVEVILTLNSVDSEIHNRASWIAAADLPYWLTGDTRRLSTLLAIAGMCFERSIENLGRFHGLAGAKEKPAIAG